MRGVRRLYVQLSKILLLLTLAFYSSSSMAKKPVPDNFLVVIREAIEAKQPRVRFTPEFPQRAEIDGELIEFNLAWYSLIGDTQIRFVYDGDTTMSNVEVEEFKSYGLTPEEAISIAIGNQEKSYGIATYSKWQHGIFIVSGGSADLDSSHFLNERLWHEIESEYPGGVVVSIPDRGTLIFAPLNDQKASSLLVNNIQRLKESSGNLGISEYPYIRRNGYWELMDLNGE